MKGVKSHPPGIGDRDRPQQRLGVGMARATADDIGRPDLEAACVAVPPGTPSRCLTPAAASLIRPFSITAPPCGATESPNTVTSSDFDRGGSLSRVARRRCRNGLVMAMGVRIFQSRV